MKFTLGNVLVAHGDITRQQLEDALIRQAGSGYRLGVELIIAGHASRQQIDEGLLRQRKVIAYALAVSAGFSALVHPPAWAKPVAAIAVSATVVARASLRSEHQETLITVTEGDVASGYVEVAVGSRFVVQTNSRAGYLLEFFPVGHLFGTVSVVGLAQTVQLASEGGVVAQRGPMALGHYELGYRFALQPGVNAGIYPWPLHLSVRAL
ncbi:MAG: hypothetical protein CFE44_09895 [Burkholderiales bacterium PBB4]|nr:MAG: hypothetical protein CFE44_09895 [Burkholderiales bacterium PBB4]